MTEQTVDLNKVTPTQEAIGMVPGTLAHMHLALPLRVFGNRLDVAMVEYDQTALNNLTFNLNMKVVVYIAPEADIKAAIIKHYGENRTNIGRVCQKCGQELCACAYNARRAAEREAGVARALEPKLLAFVLGPNLGDGSNSVEVCTPQEVVDYVQAWAEKCKRLGKLDRVVIQTIQTSCMDSGKIQH